MKNLIIETDLGHDPDDFFTLCYLIAAGVNIRQLIICPGERKQLAIAHFLQRELGLRFPICKSKNTNIEGEIGVHKQLLNKHKFYDGFNSIACEHTQTVIKETLQSFPDSEFLIIGPPKHIGEYCKLNSNPVASATMQGGFLGSPLNPLDNMRNRATMPTFNMNGAPKGAEAFINANIPNKRFCGKNVCHSVVFDHSHLKRMSQPKCRASELFIEMMKMYLARHEGKKFHDPVAAVCHLHPEIGKWVKGKPYRASGEWGTRLDESGDFVLEDINRKQFWDYVYNFR